MPKTDSQINHDRKNPFLLNRADELWNRLDKSGKHISKEELLKRANASKEKARS